VDAVVVVVVAVPAVVVVLTVVKDAVKVIWPQDVKNRQPIARMNPIVFRNMSYPSPRNIFFDFIITLEKNKYNVSRGEKEKHGCFPCRIENGNQKIGLTPPPPQQPDFSLGGKPENPNLPVF
jgi:hypothetical protein